MDQTMHPGSHPSGPGGEAKDHTIPETQASNYPKQLWWFIASFIFIVSLFRLSSVLASRVCKWRHTSYELRSIDVGDERVTNRISLRRIPVALLNGYRILAFRLTFCVGGFTINVAELFATAAYIIAIFIWTMINSTDVEGVKYDLNYYSNRAGTIASSQFPLIVALGTKNNVITLLTGVSPEKLNYLHRMTSRVTFIVLWIHAGSKIATGLHPGDLASVWLIAGLVATVAFSILCFISIRPIRARAYELFFCSHFALVLIFLVCSYYHTRRFGYQAYIWSSLLVWAIDRLLRFTRLAYFYLAHRLQHDGGFTSQLATLELLTPSLVKLSVPVPKGCKWGAGQTAYLVVPGVSKLKIEAHPFSIASLAHSGEMTFIISARKGFTRRLAKRAAEACGKAELRVLVDGPYGSAPELGGETIVLVAGETGVSFTLPLMLHIIQAARDNKTSCRKLIFVWSVRDIENIRWVSGVLQKAVTFLPQSFEVQVLVYVTKGAICTIKNAGHLPILSAVSLQPTPSATSTRTSICIDNSTEKEKECVVPVSALTSYSHVDLGAPSGVDVREGRPDLRKLLREEVDLCRGRGKLSVCVCGSQSIARAVQSALTFSPVEILKGAPSVDLHVESFGYA